MFRASIVLGNEISQVLTHLCLLSLLIGYTGRLKDSSASMPTSTREKTGLADGMQNVGGAKEHKGGYNAVCVGCGTHYSRLRNTKARLGAIKDLDMDEVQHERSYQGGGVVGRIAWTRCAEERWKRRCGE